MITFNGIPVSAPFLMSQAAVVIHKQYPNLELSPVFNPVECSVTFTGFLEYIGVPSGLVVTAPVFEKLSKTEQMRIGNVGLKQSPVAHARITGSCKHSVF